MGISELFFIAVGLSMDAFAVSVCKGLGMRRLNYIRALIIALFFGGFQALMPLIGWAVGSRFEKYITNINHWVALVLLAFIGGNMIYEAITEKENTEPCQTDDEDALCVRELFILAIATSIDALAAGVTFGVLANNDIWFSVFIIGVITFALSFLGVIIGNNFGAKFKTKAEITGGIILVLMGIKILLEHLGVIRF